jgi:hypothetical protein
MARGPTGEGRTSKSGGFAMTRERDPGSIAREGELEREGRNLVSDGAEVGTPIWNADAL